MALLKRSTLVWFGLFALAFFNGALREVGIRRFLEEPFAHHLSAVTAVLLFTAYISAIWRKTKILSRTQAVWVGWYWFTLTILTETFLLNRWVSKLTWEQILQTYNLAQGELWPLVLLWIAALPVVLWIAKGPGINSR